MNKIEKLGVQVYTIRDFMKTEKDVKESFKKLKALGYDQVQTAGSWISYEAYAEIAKEEGIEIIGTHEDYDLMVEDFDAAYKKQEILGTNIMGIGGFWDKEFEKYVEFVKQANIVGEKVRAKGGRFTYHNHHHEFIKYSNGQTAMDYLVENLNSETTSFVLDTYWVQRGGGDVCFWIKKLSDRIDILHLKDFMVYRDENEVVQPMFAEVGNGNLNWDGILEAAFDAGVKYYVVEQDICAGDPFESLKISSEFMHKNYM